MSSSPADIEREADASRERLAATLGDLRENLSPPHLIDEIFERVSGPKGSSIVQSVETVIRDHPLPMMLIGVGGAMWLGSGWRKAVAASKAQLAGMGIPTGGLGGTTPPPRPSEQPHDGGATESLKENFASVSQSIADTAYQVLRSHASAKLDEYSKMASDGVTAASDQILHAVEEQIDKTIDTISTSMGKHPLAFSALAIALGAALGGVSLRERS
jgi:hypothetical protein